MCKPNIDNLRSLIRSLLQDMKPSEESTPDQLDGCFYGGNGYLCLSKDGKRVLNLLMDELDKDNAITGKVSDRIMKDRIAVLLGSWEDTATVTDTELDKGIAELLDAIRSEVRTWVACLPVENLSLMRVDSFSIGKVVLRPHYPYAPELRDRLLGIVDTFDETEEGKERIKARVSGYFAHDFVPYDAVAEVTIRAEESRAHQLAAEEIDAALDLLRCYTHVFYSRIFRPYIGLRGSVAGGIRSSVLLGDGKQRYSYHCEQVGKGDVYEITPERVEELAKLPFSTLSAVLAKDEVSRSEIERLLARAVRWIGKGMIAPNIPEKVVNFAVALEVMMMGEERNQISKKTPQRVAYLLGKDDEDRKKKEEKAKQLYGLRCDVVHEGALQIEQTDVRELEQCSVLALTKMAGHLGKWTTHGDFRKYLKSLGSI